jgi:hypothetical protein
MARPFLGKAALAGQNAERETYALRMGLHFPLFHALSTTNFGVLHGGAVEKGGKALVVAGFEGAGKSTLSLYLCQKRGYSMLADNFVVYDSDGRVYPFLESTRLNEDSRAAVGMDGGEHVMGRAQLATQRHASALESVPVSALVHTALAGTTSLLALPPEQMSRRIKSMTESVTEFVDYKMFRTAAHIVDGNLDQAKDEQTFARFMAHTRPMAMTLGGLLSLDAQAGMVDDVL